MTSHAASLEYFAFVPGDCLPEAIDIRRLQEI